MRTASGIRAYNVLFVLVALLALPVAALACLVKPAWRRGLAARLGFGWPARTRGPVLWTHAASVGEVEAIVPVVQRWQRHHPDGAIVVSALTATGCAHARRLVPDAEVRTFPIDAPGIVGRVVRRVQPDLFLFSENEIWPNLLTVLARGGIPAVQVSGRLSPRAARGLARFPRFARTVLRRVTRYCVQADEHRARLVDLGVDPERVIVTGSLKGDARVAEAPRFVPALESLARPVVIAASTHPGEDEVVLAAAHRLRRDAHVRLLWLIAPRHPQRFAAVADLLEKSELAWVRRSMLPDDASAAVDLLADADVLLLDSLGELAGCYSAAQVAFVGATLVPIGGHNLLEAARCGVPVVVGPHLDSVRQVADRLLAAGAATVVSDGASLATAVAAFLDPQRRPDAGAAATRVAAEESGSLDATWRVV
ncbi:3-deoxy-D-manno-octulosonic acid transferase, partial [Candidatus Binatia bacterium]|nr:3-deoxy-D-manno-octulosonic acid transferase [Candidatus Binatia bacterium]